MELMTFDQVVAIISELALMHRDNPNFSGDLWQTMSDFLANKDEIADNPEKHEDVIRTMKLEAVLATQNSPFAEVRANVDPTDDPTMPVSTIRAWAIAITFSIIGSFIDNLFGFRNPSISIGSNVAQLISCEYETNTTTHCSQTQVHFLTYNWPDPLGTFLARVLPDWRFNFFGEHSLNPGPFNRKEHMLITIMANVSFSAPYTFYIVPVQAMPQYFNMSWAYDQGYQLLISLAVNLFGYGMAGLLRRFLVYPALAIWPACLNTVALIKSFHDEANEPVRGPFNRIYKASREKILLLGILAMFVYFFIPGYLFQALSLFSWITWISPSNVHLDAVFGITGGLGLNPWPTFDWNLTNGTGLYLPTYAIVCQTVGILIAAMMILALWLTNTWNTGYLPINSNSTFDNTGGRFNVTKILDSRSKLDETLYQSYSQPWFSAGYIVYNIWAFASYTATFVYTLIFNRQDIARGYRAFYRSVFKKGDNGEIDLGEDSHFRLMKVYKEVPEWWYLILLIVPIIFGCAAIAGYPTNVSVAPLFYGLIMPILLVLPLGMIEAVTGISIPLNILAALIGGYINAGDANGLIYFKCWAYLSSWQALAFVQDLKLAHYLKIPPRVTFSVQIVGTVIYALVSSLSYNFIMSIKDVCTSSAAFHFTCPDQTSFYTVTLFWGVMSPKKLFGPGQRYNMMLLGFPLGLVLVLVYWALRRRFPKSNIIRLAHPVLLCSGPVAIAAPYNMAYFIGNLYVNLFSFQYLRKKHLAFWAKVTLSLFVFLDLQYKD